MFVKICGVTHPHDASAAVAAGADAIGLNFVPGSRRRIDVETARAITERVQGDVMSVGVFRDLPLHEIVSTINALDLDAAQLHDDPAGKLTSSIQNHVGTVIQVLTCNEAETSIISCELNSDVLMIDGPVAGSGVRFDWDLLVGFAPNQRILLAGGLSPDNVAEAIGVVRPWGVDVATGVEGPNSRKDPSAIARFVSNARAAALFLE